MIDLQAANGAIAEAPTCQHHWVIEEADGPTSQGVCRFCGEAKEFRNYMTASHWGSDRERKEAPIGFFGRYPAYRPGPE